MNPFLISPNHQNNRSAWTETETPAFLLPSFSRQQKESLKWLICDCRSSNAPLSYLKTANFTLMHTGQVQPGANSTVTSGKITNASCFFQPGGMLQGKRESPSIFCGTRGKADTIQTHRFVCHHLVLRLDTKKKS